MEFPMPGRLLTDADIEAIAEMVVRKTEQKFYLGVGKGVWAVAWKVIVGALMVLGAYYYHKR